MTLRIHLDGDWDAAGFAAFFQSLDDLFNHLSLTKERDFYPEFGRIYGFGRYRIRPEYRYRLEVRSVSYSSPGFTDLVGLAAALREIREFLQYLITFVSERGKRKSAEERDKLEIASMKLELLKRLYDLEQDYGRTIPLDAEKHLGIKSKDLPDIDPLIRAALDRRITEVSNPDDND